MELFRALGCLIEAPSAESARLAALLELGEPPDDADFTETFVLQLYPYASVYLGAEGMLGGEARDRIAGFWRALGLTPPAEPDHLALLLSLHAELDDLAENASATDVADADAASRFAHARRVLFFEHLFSWLPPYLERLRELGTPFYRRLANLLWRAIRDEATRVQAPDVLPQHLRLAPSLEDLEQGGMRDFLRALLAPARSGLILTRADFARAGRDLDLPLRLGERRFLLEVLLEQAPSALPGWLSQEARRQARLWRQLGEICEPWRSVAEFWTRRAAESARRLDAL